MSNQIEVFQNEQFGEIRTIRVNDEPWFVATDVCGALDIGNPSQAISRLDADEKVTLTTNEGHSGKLGGAQMLNVISEAGLYSLILKSRKPEAKEFKRWITHDVIPMIRKTGGYVANEDLFLDTYFPGLPENVSFVFKTTLQELRKANQKVAELQPKADYLEKILQSNEALTITRIAKDYGKSAMKMNEMLHERKIQFKSGDQWVLYQKYSNKGYTQSYTATYEDNSGMLQTKTYTKWTQAGRKFIYELLKKDGILPLIEQTA